MHDHPKKAVWILSALFLVGVIMSLFFWSKTQREMFVIESDGNRVPITHIELRMDKAVPDALTLKVGEYVQFNGVDGRDHDIELGQGNEYNKAHQHSDVDFGSGKFGPEDAYRLRIKQKGVYDFHDHLHPELFVTVIAY